jgi:DNA-binding MarR family transcriptional regulator
MASESQIIELSPEENFRFLAQFRYALRRFLRQCEDSARGEHLTGQQYQLLLCIKGETGTGSMAIVDLAHSLQVAHHAAVGLIDRCEAAGLVERRQDTVDRRQVLISLTELGEARVAAVANRNRDELNLLREVLSVPAASREIRKG